MASSYPSALDGNTTIPGFPYIDDLEFVTADQANAWVGAIQAIETAIGYGPPLTAASPLYSVAYTKTYQTISARLADSENRIDNAIQIDPSAADIQPIASVAQAGNTGMAADAGHVHSGIPSQGLMPIGSIMLWPGTPSTFPSGYLQCNGQNLSATGIYNTLYTIIGTTYGGTPNVNFNLPNFNDVFPVGIGTQIATALNQRGGSQTITQAQMPSHTHAMTWTQQPHNHVPASSVNPGSGAYGSMFMVGPLPTSTLFINFGGLIDHGSYPAIGINVSYEMYGSSTVTDTITSITAANAGSGSPYTPPFLGIYFLMRCL